MLLYANINGLWVIYPQNNNRHAYIYIIIEIKFCIKLATFL